MLQLVSSGLVGMLLNVGGVGPGPAAPALIWQGLPSIAVPSPVEPKVEKTIAQYLQVLKAQGLDPQRQAVWLRTDNMQLIDRNGTIPVSAASLTKTATSLAAITTWGLDKKFETIVSTNGKIDRGVLVGDLIVTGGGDPLFVWEDAIALAQSLNRLDRKSVV